MRGMSAQSWQAVNVSWFSFQLGEGEGITTKIHGDLRA